MITRSFHRSIQLLAALGVITAAANPLHAGSSVWINTAGGTWSSAGNWLDHAVADGDGFVADFASFDILADATIHLDTPRTIGILTFGDTVDSNDWHLDDNANPANILTLSNPSNFGIINVDNRSVSFNVSLAGTAGLVKLGAGDLIINQRANYTGGTLLSAGRIVSGIDNVLRIPSDLTIADGASFELNGHNQQLGSLTGTGTVTNSSATPAQFVLSTNNTLTIQNLFTGNLSLAFSGGGSFTLLTPATYIGNTTLDGSTLISGVSNALPFTTNLTLQNNALFDLHGHPQSLTFLLGSSGTITNTDPTTTSTLTIANFANDAVSILLTGNIALTKKGTGNLNIVTAPSYTGLTTIESGNLFFNANGSSIGRVVGNGILVAATQRTLTTDALQLQDVFIQGGARLTVRPSGGVVDNTSVIVDLTLGGETSNWKSTLDLTNNSLIVVNGADVPNQLKQAANLGAWNGTAGITSSTALITAGSSTRTALAYATGAQFTANNGQTTFSGLPFLPTETLVMFTLAGDANMDGKVSFADFLQLQNHLNQPNTDWQGGDFNYDGSTTFADFLILQNNLGKSLPIDSIGIASAAAVPEPSSLILALIPLALALRRRHFAR